MIFSQGELIEVNFNYTVGHEPQKLRPALVVSDEYFNNVLSSLVVVCPITSTDKGHPLHIEIKEGNGIKGFVCTEAMRAVDLTDQRRGTKKLDCYLDKETMASVLDVIGAIFGI